MKKVAVFGGPGAGKSTLSRKLAELTQLPLYALDKLCFEPGGAAVSNDVYASRHAEILAQPAWLMEGYGSYESVWIRLAEADTLVYVDLPFTLHVWWVTKRFFKGMFSPPEGWPDNSPLLRGTLSGYRHIWLCHKYLTPRYRAYVVQASTTKQIFHLRSPADIAGFLESVGREDSGNCSAV
jgi:adenylate kinase family enzyme